MTQTETIEMTENKGKRFLKQVLYWAFLNLGILLMTVGVYFFKAPNGFATGGVSGISIILASAFPQLSQATYMAALNVLLLIIGLLVLGRDVGLKTIFCSLMFSCETWVLEQLVPIEEPLTNQPLLELVYAILLTGIGSAIIFNCNASSGGTDIVALILKKYTSLNVGRALLLTDFLIAASTFFFFGIETGLYSLLGLFSKAFLIDSVIENFNVYKYFTIITTAPDAICDYVIHELHHGITQQNAIGKYTGEDKTVLLTVCNRRDAVRLREKIKEIDPHAFVVVTSTSEIIGRGFRGV